MKRRKKITPACLLLDICLPKLALAASGGLAQGMLDIIIDVLVFMFSVESCA